MNARTIAMLALALAPCAVGFSQEVEPEAIFKEVAATYKSMQTYKEQGMSIVETKMAGMNMNLVTSFTITLKKPDKYLVTWAPVGTPDPGNIQTGAVWKSGDQPYLYMSFRDAYSKMSDDQSALFLAGGISRGAVFTAPSLFFEFLGEVWSPLFQMKDPQLEKTEKIGGEDCYVISGTSLTSCPETYWISKSRHLILKHSESMDSPEAGAEPPEIPDEVLKKTIRDMGEEVTTESVQKMRQTTNATRAVMKAFKPKGTQTELHVQISSPELSEKDFEYTPPASAVLKESLFKH